MTKKEMLKGAFGMGQELPPPDPYRPPPPPPPEVIPQESAAKVQTLVWGNQAAQAPAANDKGQVSALSPKEGWGKV